MANELVDIESDLSWQTDENGHRLLDANEEENRMMQSEIDDLYKRIDALN